MNPHRQQTAKISIGRVPIGGGAPISVQSMTNTLTSDAAATIAQIQALTAAGCDIVRVSVPDAESLAAFAAIRRASPIPLVADIHFDYKLALGAIEAGADGIPTVNRFLCAGCAMCDQVCPAHAFEPIAKP